jgi:hypothetical protein
LNGGQIKRGIRIHTERYWSIKIMEGVSLGNMARLIWLKRETR